MFSVYWQASQDSGFSSEQATAAVSLVAGELVAGGVTRTLTVSAVA